MSSRIVMVREDEWGAAKWGSFFSCMEDDGREMERVMSTKRRKGRVQRCSLYIMHPSRYAHAASFRAYLDGCRPSGFVFSCRGCP